MIPNFYSPPLWLPLNWRDEVSGQLPKAVNAYLENRIERKGINVLAVELLRDYLIQYIHAPCWTINLDYDDADGARILSELRFAATRLESADAISAWIRKAMEIGLDPL